MDADTVFYFGAYFGMYVLGLAIGLFIHAFKSITEKI